MAKFSRWSTLWAILAPTTPTFSGRSPGATSVTPLAGRHGRERVGDRPSAAQRQHDGGATGNGDRSVVTAQPDLQLDVAESVGLVLAGDGAEEGDGDTGVDHARVLLRGLEHPSVQAAPVEQQLPQV